MTSPDTWTFGVLVPGWDSTHGLDHRTGLPPTVEGYDSILVFVCALSDMHGSSSLETTLTSNSQVTVRTGTWYIISFNCMGADFWQGCVFDFKVLESISRDSGHQKNGAHRKPGYTPNNNDKVEHTNQVLDNTFRSLCNDVGTDWSENLALAEFAMNTAKHSVIDMSGWSLFCNFYSTVWLFGN